MSAAVTLLARAHVALASTPDQRAVAIEHQRRALLQRRAGQLIRAADRALDSDDTVRADRLIRLAKAALELAGSCAPWRV